MPTFKVKMPQKTRITKKQWLAEVKMVGDGRRSGNKIIGRNLGRPQESRFGKRQGKGAGREGGEKGRRKEGEDQRRSPLDHSLRPRSSLSARRNKGREQIITRVV